MCALIQVVDILSIFYDFCFVEQYEINSYLTRNVYRK